MAKILVADDNSNVQKTVALALADLGVEIVSVNNGEAAVRKLPEVWPDLVLADIFMPVRNGYEVCEYVKKDSRFARVPVVLLVGAFDPLDEREAQRVGADGILKKPFVPTDPLITMVKMLLDRTLGERLVGVSASERSTSVQTRGSASPTAKVRNAEVHSPAPEKPDESWGQESGHKLPHLAERVAFGLGERPVAFGQLLETATQEAVEPNTAVSTELSESAVAEPGVNERIDDEQVLTSSRPATLGDPIFWRNDAPEQEREPEEPEASTSIGPKPHGWKQGENVLPRRDEAAILQPIDPLELVRDDQDESSPTLVDTQSIPLDPADQAPLTVESGKPDDLASNPLEWMETAPAEQSSETSEPTAAESSHPVPDAAGPIDKDESSPHPLGFAEVSEHTPEQGSTPVLIPVLALPDTAVPDTTLATPALDLPTAPQDSAQAAPLHPESEGAPSSSSQNSIDEAHSVPKTDWADLAAPIALPANELIIDEDESESVPETATSALPTSAEAAPLDSEPEIATGSSSHDAVNEAHSHPKADWADPAAPISSAASGLVTELDTDKNQSHSVPETATPVLGTPGEATPLLPEPEVAPSFALQSTIETARSISKEEWADLTAKLDSTKDEVAIHRDNHEATPTHATPLLPPIPLSAIAPIPAFVPAAPLPPVSHGSPSSGSPSSSSRSTTDTAHSLPIKDWANLDAPLDSSESAMPAHPDKYENKSESVPFAHLSAAIIGTSQHMTSPAPNVSPDPALVEAVVQRVLEKMRPQVVDLITKEFLRPIVQALVHREIEKT